MLQNAYLLAKIGADTAENEQHFAEILLKIDNYPTGRLTPWRRPPSDFARGERRGDRELARAGVHRAVGEGGVAAGRGGSLLYMTLCFSLHVMKCFLTFSILHVRKVDS